MLFKHRHKIVLDEKDVMKALKIIDDTSIICILNEMEIGNCGWADEPTMWFIHFTFANTDWSDCLSKLKQIRSLRIMK